MPNMYDFVINYMREDIGKIFDLMNSLNVDITDLNEFIYHLIKHDSAYKYPIKVFKEIYSNRFEDIYNKYNESIYILDRVFYDELRREPQIKAMLSFIKNIGNDVNELINQKNTLYEELKQEYLYKKNMYSKYMDIINGNVKSDEDRVVIEDFFAFLRNSILDKNKVNDLINDISRNKIIHIEEIDEETKEDKEKKENGKTVIPTLEKEVIHIIEKYKNIFESLDEKQKNSIMSAYELIVQGYQDNLENVAYGFNKSEILYYCSIYTLINLYQNYNELFKEKYLKEASEDKDLFDVLVLSIKDIIDNITKNLNKINKFEEEMEKEEEQQDEIKGDNHNIILFLDDDILDKDGHKESESIVNIDIQYMKKIYGGEAYANIKRVLRMLNTRFRSMSNEEFRNLGVDANKPLFNHSNYDEFDSFNVRLAKGKVNNPVRITYINMPISENNKKELCTMYDLPSDANIYLIVGLFLKKSDDAEYVRMTHNRLFRQHDNILKLQQMFENDFNDITRFKVKKMIDNSYEHLEILNNALKDVNIK